VIYSCLGIDQRTSIDSWRQRGFNGESHANSDASGWRSTKIGDEVRVTVLEASDKQVRLLCMTGNGNRSGAWIGALLSVTYAYRDLRYASIESSNVRQRLMY
jgi:hypothetical protein